MVVTVNGQPREIASGVTLSSVIGQLPGVPEGRGVAVALEGEVVPRAAWQRTILEEGSRIEIVVAVQGG